MRQARGVVLCIAVLAAAVGLGALTYVVTVAIYPHGAVRAQSPTPLYKFANVEPPSTTVPRDAEKIAGGIVVEGVGDGCAAATLQQIQEATVYWLNQGWQVWTELSIDSFCGKTISQYQNDVAGIIGYTYGHAPAQASRWRGIMLDEESAYGFTVAELTSLNGYVLTALNAYALPPAWLSTEVFTGQGNWSQGQFNTIVYGSYPAPQIASDYMVQVTNSFYQSFGTPNLVTWSSTADYPQDYNSESESVTPTNGTPYSVTVGSDTYYYSNEFCPGSCLPPAGDTDRDGCSATRELQTAVGSETSGGRRDPNYFWDFYDVWTRAGASSPWRRDKFVNPGGDVLGVANRFGAQDAGGTAPINRNSDPLAGPPPVVPGYHPDYDRGPLVGPNPWNLGAPDGAITANVDVLGVAKQFGHSCL